MPELPPDLDDTIGRAIDEDIGSGDVTTESVVPQDERARAVFVAKADGIVAGLPVAQRVFEWMDDVQWVPEGVADGSRVEAGTVLASLRGKARTILTCERVALNFLTHLSGVATLAGEYVDACAGSESVILCTRKTLPGLRALERYAVEVGGGMLHRASLHDAVLVKDNHVAIAGGVAEAVRRAKTTGLEVEVEVETLEQLEEALGAGADRVLLDNPDAELVKRAVDVVGTRVPLEVSGGMTLEKVREIAGLGMLMISVGRITHSAPALDISLEIEPA